MGNNDIIAFIKNNLNDDFDHNFNYLMSELMHYQKLRGGEEIVSEIIKLFRSELGEAGLKKLNEEVNKSFKVRIAKFNEAIKLLKEKKKSEAQDILVKLIDTFPIKKSKDDVVPVYNFQNLFESLLFTKKVQPQNQFRQINEPIGGYYFHLALIFFEEKDYEESIKMLNQVLEYNPVYVEAYLLKAECYLQEGHNDLFFENIKKALLYSYTRVHLAKCYFLLGRYYLDLENKEIALSFLVMSKHYDQTPFIDGFIQKAVLLTGEFIDFAEPADLIDNFKKVDIQFGPSKEVFEVLDTCVKEARDNNNVKLIKYFLTIMFNLTENQQIKKELDALK